MGAILTLIAAAFGIPGACGQMIAADATRDAARMQRETAAIEQRTARDSAMSEERMARMQLEAEHLRAREREAAEREARARAMNERYREGATLAEIGREYGVSKERVRQLLALYGFTRRGRGGAR